MNQNEYLENRLDDQIEWYDRKSQRNQRWYKRLRIAEIVFAVSIPFLTGYITTLPIFKFIVGLLGVFIAVIAGIISLYRFQENWIKYRTTCESLKHEKSLFLTQTDPYDAEDSFPLFVQHVEVLVSEENTNWAQIMKRPRKEMEDG